MSMFFLVVVWSLSVWKVFSYRLSQQQFFGWCFKMLGSSVLLHKKDSMLIFRLIRFLQEYRSVFFIYCIMWSSFCVSKSILAPEKNWKNCFIMEKFLTQGVGKSGVLTSYQCMVTKFYFDSTIDSSSLTEGAVPLQLLEKFV